MNTPETTSYNTCVQSKVMQQNNASVHPLRGPPVNSNLLNHKPNCHNQTTKQRLHDALARKSLYSQQPITITDYQRPTYLTWKLTAWCKTDSPYRTHETRHLHSQRKKHIGPYPQSLLPLHTTQRKGAMNATVELPISPGTHPQSKTPLSLCRMKNAPHKTLASMARKQVADTSGQPLTPTSNETWH